MRAFRFRSFVGFGSLLAATALGALPAHADDDTTQSRWEASARASTLGIGVEVRYTINDSLAVRGSFNSFDYGIDEEYSDVAYDGDLELRSGGVLLDWHPGGAWFRVTAGALLNGNELVLDAEPTAGTFEFNDVEYTAAQVGSASGTAEFDDIAPYLGIGFAKSPESGRGLALSFDIGVLFQGSPSFSLDVRCGNAVPASTCTQIQRDADAERAEFEDDADDYDMYPVLSLGVGYRF